MRLLIHGAEYDAHEVALWRAALAFAVELDRAVGELVAIKPNDGIALHLDGGRAVFFDEFRQARRALPASAGRDRFKIGRDGFAGVE